MEYNDQNLKQLYGQGLSYAQIATALGVGRGTISRRISRLLKNDPSLERRKQGINPLGKTRVYPERKPVVKLRNRNSIGVRPHKYRNPTKSEMYEDLRKAVENTK